MVEAGAAQGGQARARQLALRAVTHHLCEAVRLLDEAGEDRAALATLEALRFVDPEAAERSAGG